MTQFKTRSGSLYQLDGKRIRRLVGTTEPTARQGIDGTWRDFLYATELRVGAPLLVCWEVVEDVHRSTLTSPVESIA